MYLLYETKKHRQAIKIDIELFHVSTLELIQLPSISILLMETFDTETTMTTCPIAIQRQLNWKRKLTRPTSLQERESCMSIRRGKRSYLSIYHLLFNHSIWAFALLPGVIPKEVCIFLSWLQLEQSLFSKLGFRGRYSDCRSFTVGHWKRWWVIISSEE